MPNIITFSGTKHDLNLDWVFDTHYFTIARFNYQ
jgi:hypothetical protein